MQNISKGGYTPNKNKIHFVLEKASRFRISYVVWDITPNDIRNMESVRLFKHIIKAYYGSTGFA